MDRIKGIASHRDTIDLSQFSGAEGREGQWEASRWINTHDAIVVSKAFQSIS